MASINLETSASPLAVLRPEPGNAATAARIEALGHAAIRLPLFAARALDWTPPDPGQFDAMLLTSANTVRTGGRSLDGLAGLPVFAVGEATAAAARAAGLSVAWTGAGDGADLTADAEERGVRRALLLAARDRRIDRGGIVADAIAVYAMEPLTIADVDLRRTAESVVLLHSPRAASRFAELVDVAGISRAALRIAAISAAAALAAGDGWAGVAIAASPNDDALIGAALALAD